MASLQRGFEIAYVGSMYNITREKGPRWGYYVRRESIKLKANAWSKCLGHRSVNRCYGWAEEFPGSLLGAQGKKETQFTESINEDICCSSDRMKFPINTHTSVLSSPAGMLSWSKGESKDCLDSRFSAFLQPSLFLGEKTYTCSSGRFNCSWFNDQHFLLIVSEL